MEKLHSLHYSNHLRPLQQQLREKKSSCYIITPKIMFLEQNTTYTINNSFMKTNKQKIYVKQLNKTHC